MLEGDSRLWKLELQFWLGGVEVYRQHLADNSLMVYVKQGDDWRLALHQQSPESKPK